MRAGVGVITTIPEVEQCVCGTLSRCWINVLPLYRAGDPGDQSLRTQPTRRISTVSGREADGLPRDKEAAAERVNISTV